MFAAVDDPRRPTVPPRIEEVPPHLNFAPLENAVEVLTHSADRYQEAAKSQSASKKPMKNAALRSLNQRLIQSERKLTHPNGLPGRPWFKHLIYAPGFYTGYGVKTIPGVREAIEQKKWKEAEGEIVRAAKALEDYSALVDSTTTEFEREGK